MTEKEREARRNRLVALFPRRKDRWEFQDLYCNRGSSVTVRMPRMPQIKVCDFDSDCLIEVLFYKIFRGDFTDEHWAKLMKGLRPLHKEHKTNKERR